MITAAFVSDVLPSWEYQNVPLKTSFFLNSERRECVGYAITVSVSAIDVNLKLEKEPGKSDRVCRTCARKTSVAAEHIDRCIRTPILIENKMFKIH